MTLPVFASINAIWARTLLKHWLVCCRADGEEQRGGGGGVSITALAAFNPICVYQPNSVSIKTEVVQGVKYA